MAQNANIVAYPQKIIVVPTTQKIDVIGATEGPPGPQGPTGPQGPPGDASQMSAPGTDGQVVYNNNGYFGGSTSLYFNDASGNVGIGVSNPEAMLEVARSTNGEDTTHINGQLRLQGVDPTRLTIEATNSTNLWNIDNANGTLRFFREDWSASGTGTGGLIKFIIEDNGNVGVGTSTPEAPLHVYHATTGTVARFESDSGSAYIGFGDSTTTGDWFRQRIGASGNDLRFVTNNNTSRMVILSNGNVGINDDTPSYRLDVNGTGRFTGNLTANALTTGTATVTLVNHSNTSSYDKVRVWDNSFYSIGMVSGINYGHLGDFAMTFRMNSDNNRGFWWGDDVHDANGGAMSLTTTGRLTVATSLSVGQGESSTSPSTETLYVHGNMSMQSGNSIRPSIYRVGGVYFTWDSDSYGTNTHHSIRSTDGDTWSDDITINSYGNVRINIDSNNNGANNFYIQSHGTGTGNVILRVPDTGAGIYLEQGWYRTSGQHGWYNETYGGGIYMTDTTWVRTYNSRGLHSPSNIDASGYVYAGDQFRAFKALSLTNGSWNYQQAHVRLDANNSALAISGHPHGGHANMFVWATGSGTIFVRNWNNTGYAAIEGTIYNTSHSSLKKNITPLRPKSVGAAASKTVLSDILKQIELVEYELKPENTDAELIPDNWETMVWDEELEREVPVPNKRRQAAYERLNSYLSNSNLEPYQRIHECGRDCNNAPEDPCRITRNANMRIPGFIAEQAVEHIPGVVAVNDAGEGHSVNLIALSGFLMGVCQEMVERIEDLESQSNNPTT